MENTLQYKKSLLIAATTGLLLFACLVVTTHAMAQVPAPAQERPVALRGGDIHLHTGEVIAGGTILFDKGKIVEIGSQVSLPAGTEVIDIAGKQVHAGFILARTSLGLTEIGRAVETTDMNEFGDINPNVRVQVAFHPASGHIGVAAVHGITTIVPTPAGGLISGQTAAMHSDGWTWEQMVLKAPVGMAISWPATGRAEARKKALEALNGAFDEARRYQKARSTAQTGTGQAIDLRWEAMLPVLDRSLPVFVSANEVAHMQEAMAWAGKEQVRMVLVGARDAGYIAPQLAARRIPVMLSPVIGGPSRQWEAYDKSYSTARQLFEAGVEFCIAGEAGAAGAYRLSQHAAAAVAFGLPQDEALRAISINAARILGIDHLTGSLEPGKDASLIVTSGNPLEIWTATEMVFVQGRRLDNADRHLQLYERYMEKLRQETP